MAYLVSQKIVITAIINSFEYRKVITILLR